MIKQQVFLTGCDSATEWQLPWFINNYMKHNNTPLWVADFGMSEEMLEHLSIIDIHVLPSDGTTKVKGWFKKPRTIYEAALQADVVCWLDTDCEVTADISSIFKYYQKGKIGMVQDRPWTTRRPDNGPWYNSGVVLTNANLNLKNWMKLCESDLVRTHAGDQEVLHFSLNEIEKIGVIEPLPHKFNTLRLDYIDGINIVNPFVIHHTGAKGNAVIRNLMK